MLKRHHRFFQSIQLFRDAVLVGIAFYLAYVVRFAFPRTMPYTVVADAHETLLVGVATVLVWPVVGWLGGLYGSHRARSLAVEIFCVLRTSVIAFLLLVTFTYFFREDRYSRGVLVLWALFTCTGVSVARAIARLCLRWLRARGYNLRHVIVVGTGGLAATVLRLIDQQSSLGFRVRGVVCHSEDRLSAGERVAGKPVLGTVSDLQMVLQQHTVDQVIVALPVEQLGVLKQLMEVLSKETVDVRLVPDVNQYVTLCGSIEEFSGVPIINLQSTPLSGWSMVAKRLFDVLVAVVALVVMAPVMALIALWLKLYEGGPVLFCQERVGMDGRCFRMYKFRTMRVDAEGAGARMTVPDDPRRTPLGRILRRLSLDELPQLWNVLKGDMSLVGPRPEQPAFIEAFKQQIPRYALRHKIKAGMTGWAQINGMRGNTSIRKRIELDLYYIEHWSILLDIKILLRTIFGGFLSPNAY